MKQRRPHLAPELVLLVPELARAHDVYQDTLDDAVEPTVREALARYLAVIDRALAVIGKQREQLELLEERLDTSLTWDWLALLADAAYLGLDREALALADALEAAGVPLADVDAERAMVHARAGRREAALTQLAQNVARFPHDLDVQLRAADVLQVCGEDGRAEMIYRDILSREDHVDEDDDLDIELTFLAARDGLEELLVRQKRRAEALELRRETAVRYGSYLEGEDEDEDEEEDEDGEGEGEGE